MKNLFNQLTHKSSYYIEELFAFITPPECPSCGVLLDDPHIVLCQNCTESFKFSGGGPVCLLCQAPRPVVCSCRPDSGKQTPDLYYWSDYSDTMRNLIHKYKFEGHRNIGEFLAEQAIKPVREKLVENGYDFAIPIPMYNPDKDKRGFNQAEQIAGYIATIIDIEIENEILSKSVRTKLQAKLDASQRWENVRGVFSVREEATLKNKKILLIDDIVTTGATCSSAAETLYKAGAKSIDVFAIVCNSLN